MTIKRISQAEWIANRDAAALKESTTKLTREEWLAKRDTFAFLLPHWKMETIVDAMLTEYGLCPPEEVPHVMIGTWRVAYKDNYYHLSRDSAYDRYDSCSRLLNRLSYTMAFENNTINDETLVALLKLKDDALFEDRVAGAEEELAIIREKMMKGTLHNVYCNGNHDEPIGGDSCSCYGATEIRGYHNMQDRNASLTDEVQRLRAENQHMKNQINENNMKTDQSQAAYGRTTFPDLQNSPTFFEELTALVNKHSLENASNTPDFILALYLNGCLEAFNTATKRRTLWYNGSDSQEVDR